ncbi:PAS domain S-box [Synechococcus sp. PCC 7502]|uniref:PAS domain-containing protein n=1 Tax=Synechococcus sp. PCC 7502 TaxID=1173263 RepID=UPI00029FA009|nr:PAS domain-containing protein [Synechococcus sp. PCC 7502]AFY73309.1 PAS domain S-box [Synechococcus sp. PCC 7502]
MMSTSNPPIPNDLLSAIDRNPSVVTADTTVMVAIAMMGETGSNYVLVVESIQPERAGLIGILTERDIVRICTQPIPLNQLPIQTVMSHPVTTLHESALTDITNVLELLQQNRIRHLPILDDQDRIVGLLDKDSLVEIVRKQAEMNLLQLNKDLEAKVKQRTAALQASELTNRTMLEAIPDLLLRLQRDGSCLAYINPGIETGDFLPIVNHISEVLPPDLLQNQLQIIGQAIATGELQVYEHSFLKQDRVVYEEVRILAINDQEVLAIVRDIGDRKQAEAALHKLNQNLERRVERRTAALQRSESRLREAQQIARLGDWNLDLLNQKLIWSAEVFKIFGLDPNQPEPTYEEMLQYYPLDERKRVTDFVDRAIQGEPYEADFQVIRADGSSVHTFAKAEPIWDASGQVIGLFGIVMDISDRKAIQEALQHSEERARATLLALPDLVFRVNRDGQYLDFLTSPQGKNLVDPDQAMGKSIYEALPADIVPTHSETKYAALQQALATQTVQSYEQEVWIEGKLRHEEVRVAPCNHDEVVFFVRDISDRKQIEKSLRESQQFIQTIIDTIPLSLFWKNRESVYLGCNQQLAAILGLSSTTEIIGKTDFDLSFLEAEAIAYRADDQRVMESAEPRLVIEETLTLPNGEQRWLETHKAPLRDSEGQIIGLVGITQDVTTRRQTEARLKHQAEHKRLLGLIIERVRSSLNLEEILNDTIKEIRQVLQSDRVLIYRLAPNGAASAITETVLPNWLKILNIEFPESVITQDRYDYYVQGAVFTFCDRENDNQSVLPSVREFFAKIQVKAAVVVPIIQHQTLWGFLSVHQCDFPRQWQDWEINLLKQIASQLAIAIQQASLHQQIQSELLIRRETEIKLTSSNEELSTINEELARATRLKDEFLANMSHELRTPLNAILGMTEGLQEQVFGSVNERQIKALQTVERSSNHLLELINDILDIAKIESGQMVLDRNLCSVSLLCQSSLAFVKQQALKKGIQLEIKIQLNLPDLLVDERRIRQVLINLLNNAVKFTPEGGRITLEVKQLPPISTTDSASPQFLHIAVIDTGIGISPENIKKLFQPFIQIDSALNRQYEGTGLGLALVKRIVELHDGTVGLTSELGVGSRFTIDLPYDLNFAISPEAIVEDKLTTTSELSSSDNKALILLVEDNEANISTFTSYLKAKGYRITVAKNGEEAIALVQTETPDLILMDIQMPGMDGIEAIKHIREDLKLDIHIIALTALTMPGDRERCLTAGANDYLAKPVKLKQLVSTIQAVLAVS